MFKYNDWSDLKDSDILVMPIRKEGDKILCLTENEEEIYFDFDDFDFDKFYEETKGIGYIESMLLYTERWMDKNEPG